MFKMYRIAVVFEILSYEMYSFLCISTLDLNDWPCWMDFHCLWRPHLILVAWTLNLTKSDNMLMVNRLWKSNIVSSVLNTNIPHACCARMLKQGDNAPRTGVNCCMAKFKMSCGRCHIWEKSRSKRTNLQKHQRAEKSQNNLHLLNNETFTTLISQR